MNHTYLLVGYKCLTDTSSSNSSLKTKEKKVLLLYDEYGREDWQGWSTRGTGNTLLVIILSLEILPQNQSSASPHMTTGNTSLIVYWYFIDFWSSWFYKWLYKALKKDKKIVQEGSGDPIAWYFYCAWSEECNVIIGEFSDIKVATDVCLLLKVIFHICEE